MLFLKLGTLVQRGLSVLVGGKADNTRLGTGYAASYRTPEIRISLRRPSHSASQEFPPAMRLRHADDRVDVMAAYGAGRSQRCAGSLSRSVGWSKAWSKAWCKPALQTAIASARG